MRWQQFCRNQCCVRSRTFRALRSWLFIYKFSNHDEVWHLYFEVCCYACFYCLHWRNCSKKIVLLIIILILIDELCAWFYFRLFYIVAMCAVWYGMVWHGSALHTWSECIRAALSSFTRTSLAHTQTYTSHMCWINNSFFTLTPRTHQRYGIIIGAFTIHSIHFLAAPSYDREIYESLGGETIKYW